MGVTAVFAVLTATLTVVGVLSNPAILVLALMFGLSTYLMYYHVSGKMAARVYERVEEQAATNDHSRRRGGFGAGPRDEWRPPRDGQRARGFAQQVRDSRQRTRRTRQQRSGGRQRRSPQGLTTAEAYQRLDLDPGADDHAVKQAYREKVKDVHPDTETGSEAEFKRVKAAYETLTGD